MRPHTLIGAALGVCLLSQDSRDLDGLLKLPTTPASVAMLATHVTAPAAQQKLADALKDPHADVRGVAARVLFVGHVGQLKTNLLDALDAELDTGAAVEEIRAAVALGGLSADARVLAAARRRGELIMRAYVRAAVRTRPEEFLRNAATLLPLLPTPTDQAEALAAVAMHATLLDGVFDQIARANAQGVLDLASPFFEAFDFTSPDTVPILARALHAPQQQIRSAAVWRLASLYAIGYDLHPDVLGLLTSTPAAPDSEDAFVRDMLGRVMGKPPAANWAAALRDQHWNVPETLDAWMSKEEFQARFPTPTTPRTQSKRPKRESHVAAPPDRPRGRALPAFSAALMHDLMTIAHCDDRGLVAKSAAEIHYDAAGWPSRVMRGVTDPPNPACDSAMGTAAVLTVAADDVRQPALHTDIVYFAIDPAIGACATTAGPLAPGLAFASFHDKRITPPEVTHEQKPQYTQDAMNRHVEGTAWVRATVMPQGCVSEASIIRPLDPGLDVQAMRAVANWKFRPALLDGQPVPVDVVIEVSFTFKK